MAKGGLANPAAALGEATRFADLRSRLLFLIGALIVYRVGTFIPVPGIDPQALAQFFQEQSGTILAMFNMFSGGALERLSIFALGVMPYISASIIVQMAGIVIPQMNQLRKEGESGRRKLTQYTRYGTVGLALVQSLGASIALQNQGLVINPGFSFIFTAVVTLITGTIFLMWLGEQITERGIGNGMSLIIFAGIVVNFPRAVISTVDQLNTGQIGRLGTSGWRPGQRERQERHRSHKPTSKPPETSNSRSGRVMTDIWNIECGQHGDLLVTMMIVTIVGVAMYPSTRRSVTIR